MCLAGTFVGPFLNSPRLSNVLLAGVLTGFLPCGLVYGYLALASSSASIRDGLLTMCIFGAGTGPLMILAGTGASLLSHGRRRNLLRISAVCVVLTGSGLDHPRDLVHPAHARARSCSLSVLRRVKLGGRDKTQPQSRGRRVSTLLLLRFSRDSVTLKCAATQPGFSAESEASS